MTELIPIRRVLLEAEATNQRLGHENLGFLSRKRGFLSLENPRQALSPSHKMWDEVAAELPELFRTLNLRRRLESMPLLSASEDVLPNGDLYRAAVIFSILAHAYHYVEPGPYTAIPESIQKPWEEISRRLHRPAPHLSFIDMNLYNWRLIDPSGPISIENMQMLVPIVGNEDERRFQCAPTEIVARFTPLLESVVRAQEAVAQDDCAALKNELVQLTDAFNELTFSSFMKVHPNAYNPLYVDPVVWGKTVAPLATPFQPVNAPPGPSGTAIPNITLMDIFFGRNQYTTSIGHETDRARSWFPPHWQALLNAAEEISVPDYVRRCAEPELVSLFQQAMDAYCGEAGLIGRHRMKAYGYLDLSFKAGRSRTLGGFDGGFEDRLWDRMYDELEHARQERYIKTPASCHFVRIKKVEPLDNQGEMSVNRVVLDISGAGIRYQPGDRCAILPENDPELVQKTLDALRATGDEPIPLNAVWRAAVQLRDGHQGAAVLPLRTLLTFGRIRPISRETAKILLAISHNQMLHQIIEAHAEDQWELWDLLQQLAEAGFNPRRLWQITVGEREHIARIVPPETFRTYSISSVMADDQAHEMHLTIGGLRYQTPATPVSRAGVRTGTASSYLSRLATDKTAASHRRVSVKIIHPPRFGLPTDPTRPVVMFAGGTGIAPFRSMIQARAAQSGGDENWLFFGARNRSELYYQAEWEQLTATGRLQFRAALSQEDTVIDTESAPWRLIPGQRARIDTVLLDPATSEKLWQLIQQGACFYICGRTGFAKTVLETVETIIQRQLGETAGRDYFYRMVGEDRYLQEVFTTYAGAQFEQEHKYHASEVVLHNNPQAGYWIVVNGRVYDVTEFAQIHPGGLKIIQSYAGMDATLSYKKVQHDLNPEVDSLLGMYQLGAIQRLDFGVNGGIIITQRGLQFASLTQLYETWVRFLYMVVEMENALINDYSIRDEQVTHNEKRGQTHPSRYRTQLLLGTHQRFLHDYLARATGKALEQLWAVTSGLCSDRADYRWMQQKITSLQIAPAGLHAHHIGAQILEDLREIPESDLPGLANLVERICHADHEFLRQLKFGLRNGLQILEKYQSGALRQGRFALLEAVQTLPQALEHYYTSLAE